MKSEVQYKTVKYNSENFKNTIKTAVQVNNQLFNLQWLMQTSHWKSSSNRKKPWRKKHQDLFRSIFIDIDTIKIKRSDRKKKQKEKCFNYRKKEHFARECFKKIKKKIKFNDNGIEVQIIYLGKNQSFKVPETLLQEVDKESQENKLYKERDL